MEKIKINSRFVTIKFTHEEVVQLMMCCGQANTDGDHAEWMKSAGATSEELKALENVMEIVQNANAIVQEFKTDAPSITRAKKI